MLHAHLPYVRHPEHDDPLEERWLHEAILDCYLPLIGMMERLRGEGVAFRLTISVSPPLAEMLRDALLRARFEVYLGKVEALAGRELERTRSDAVLRDVARMHAGRVAAARATWSAWGGDLVAAFGSFAGSGHVDMITTSATHGFLPLLATESWTVDQQIAVGLESHRRHFGAASPGFWLPECGFVPGFDARLGRAGVPSFFLETHGLLYGKPGPRRGTFAPVRTPGGPAAFGRDLAGSRAVWSAADGYPGDPRYLEHHRDIGHDLTPEQLAPLMHGTGIRLATGFKYHSITGRGAGLGEKGPYDPAAGEAAAREHAAHFVAARMQHAGMAARLLDRPALFTLPFDAELFGHWWFEGPMFLEQVIRRLAEVEGGPRMVTPADYLALYGENETIMPAQSSWGEGGFATVWLGEATEWIYPRLDHAARRLARMKERGAGAAEGPEAARRGRIIAQATRELLLAQSSDWPFMIKMKTTVEYATRRINDHFGALERLAAGFERGEGAGEAGEFGAFLAEREGAWPIFGWIGDFAGAQNPA